MTMCVSLVVRGVGELSVGSSLRSGPSGGVAPAGPGHSQRLLLKGRCAFIQHGCRMAPSGALGPGHGWAWFVYVRDGFDCCEYVITACLRMVVRPLMDTTATLAPSHHSSFAFALVALLLYPGRGIAPGLIAR